MTEVLIVMDENRSTHDEVWNASTVALVRGGKTVIESQAAVVITPVCSTNWSLEASSGGVPDF